MRIARHRLSLIPDSRFLIPILGVWRIAHDPAKVEDQVRLLTRMLVSAELRVVRKPTTVLLTTRHSPLSTRFDAGARRRGNRLQTGGSGFDSHRRLFSSKMLAGPAAHPALSSIEAVGRMRPADGF